MILLLTSCTAGRLRGSSTGWSPALSSDGVVYVGTKQGEVLALEDGGFESLRVKWTFCYEWESAAHDKCSTANDIRGLGGVYATPVEGPELLYVSGVDGYLYALDKVTGMVRDRGWRREAAMLGQELLPLIAGPALDSDRNLVLVGSENGNLYAFDARPRSSGQDSADPLRWTFATGDKIWSTAAICDGIAYFGSHDNYVYAVDVDSGEEVWRFLTGGVVAGRPLVLKVVSGRSRISNCDDEGDPLRDTVGETTMVVVGSFDKKLYALDGQRGTPVWAQPVEGDNWFWAGAVANDRTIFAPSMDGSIYAIDIRGSLLWKHNMGAAIVSQPALVSRGLVVAAKDGKLSLLNINAAVTASARVISSISVADDPIRAPLFADGDAVFVGAQDSTVTRLNMDTQRQVWCFDTERNAQCPR